MAVTIEAQKDGRRLDNIKLVVSGTLNTTVLSTDLEVITPEGDIINVDLSPENFSVPVTLPVTRNISAYLLGIDEYIDGVYSFTYTVNYSDLSTEITSASVILFDNHAIAAWFDLMERHILLNWNCTDEEKEKRQTSREMIQAAQEAYYLFRYDDAKTLIDGALEIINSCN